MSRTSALWGEAEVNGAEADIGWCLRLSCAGNLSEAAFVEAFGGVDHANYIAMVEEIDRRIADRPAFAARL